MNIAYPISEILKCVEIINQPKKKFYKNNDKIFNLNNNVRIKKIVNDDDTQLTKEKKEKESYVEIHDDDDDTARIGRSGDPLKI